MMKSLYVRVVIIFIAAVMLSVAVAFIVTSLHSSTRIHQLEIGQLTATGKKIIQSYSASAPDRLDEFLKGVAVSPNNRIQIFRRGNDAASPLFELNASGSEQFVTNEQLDSVLKGGLYRGRIAAELGAKGRGPDRMMVGLPFQVDHIPYALFITPNFDVFLDEVSRLLRFAFLIVLASGSLLVLVAAQYLVRPLLRLTEATRKIAKGDFDVDLRSKRRDEIGVLTNSFGQMAKELGRVDRMRQDFVASVSHEIQSPLTSISGFTKALKHKKMDEARRLELLTIIEEESERLSRLGENLLQLSSLQHEQQPLNPSLYRLDEQLRQVVIAFEPQWSAKRLAVEPELAPISIAADEDRLRQVWINLLGNAIKYTPANGSIRIDAEERHGTAVVRLTDSGGGIPEEEREEIFKPFYRVDKTGDRSAGGSGLGLSIAKRIVDIHGGDIEVTGADDQGTIFTVKLPLKADM